MMNKESERRQALGFLAMILALVSGLSMLINLSDEFHCNHHGDSIMPIMISLMKWTPFVWEEDRFGMLIPLMFTWLKSPFWNLFWQNFTQLFCLLGTPFAFSYACFRNPCQALWVGCLSVLSMLLLFGPGMIFLMGSSCQCYFPAALLSAWAVYLVRFHNRRRTLPAIFLLFGLILWVNIAMISFIGIIVFYDWLSRRDAKRLFSGLLLLLGFAINYWLVEVQLFKGTRWGFVPMSQWSNVLTVVFGGTTHGGWRVISIFTVLLGAWTWWRCGRLLKGCELVFLMAWLIYVAPLIVSRHVAAAGYPGRYFDLFFVGTLIFYFDVLVIIARKAALNLAERGPALSRLKFWCSAILAGSVVIAFQWVYPYSGIKGIRTTLDDKFGGYTQVISDQQIHLIVGSYWHVWPTLFHVMWKRHESNVPQDVYGVALRCWPTGESWRPYVKPGAKVLVFNYEKPGWSFPLIYAYTGIPYGLTKQRRIKEGIIGYLDLSGRY